ncbi:MAG: acyl-CoA reductase [Saprospiraceae bacterium]
MSVTSQFIIDHLDEWKNEILSHSIDKQNALEQAKLNNPWFTELEIERMLNSICNEYLEREKLLSWFNSYSYDQVKSNPKNIAIIAAGNIPLVGFHDMLCSIISGHSTQIKLSEKDKVLPVWIFDLLTQINPSLKEKIKFVSQIKDFDAVVATGSDLAGDHFKYYFGKYPHIIRSHRNGIALLNGQESTSEIIQLGEDLFSYYGLGCRNVSKIYVPKDYDFIPLIKTLDEHFRYVRDLTKYFNNYEYNLAIHLLNRSKFLQGDSCLFLESTLIPSRIAIVHYEYYDHLNITFEEIKNSLDKIQCIVTNIPTSILPCQKLGSSQHPSLANYADDMDTMKFLTQDIYSWND